MTPHAKKYIEYLREERQMTPVSVKDYLTALGILCREIEPEKATEHSHVNDAIKKIKAERNWSARTTCKVATCIKNYYGWLAREKIIAFNPFPFHDFKKGRVRDPQFITDAEYKTIILDPFLSTQESALIRLLWDCAPRVSELCSLDQSDINFDEGYIHVPREKSKGGYSDRFIPFTPETGRLLKERVEILRANGVQEAIFVNKWWLRITPRDASEWLTKIGARRTRCREAMRLTPHMFRHSFGVRMVPLLGEIITSKFLGHSSLSMTQHYTHMDKDSALKIYKNLALKSA